MIHFCKLTFSGDVSNCSIRLIKGKNRKDDLQLTILKITYILITYINILSLERSRLKSKPHYYFNIIDEIFYSVFKRGNFKKLLYSKFLNENILVCTKIMSQTA